ncbi:uncharacterized protein LOC104908297 [Beta vulgaris subsp. vulgaris]|uniref:uncharacterized protein LOC104908297 n=1 Tax=Beta vulgaris subsp. vulgaris TaxID=3555 RepID=UPI002546AE8E|nr:uncharacterized protein LOC104908297 [Beta vulgaris subsp. vulgaris]XP_057246666.1 uncharacterized protein LOC104908297 [Beta vulgaris subsp. vulgaris]
MYPETLYKLVSLQSIEACNYNDTNLIDILGIVVHAGKAFVCNDDATRMQEVVVLDRSCVAVRLILMNQFVSEYENEVQQSAGQYNTLLACGVYVRKMNAYFLITGRYTRLFINPNNVDASTLLDWFVCDNFAKRKMKWFNNYGLSINRALSTSNAIRTTIASYKQKRKVCDTQLFTSKLFSRKILLSLSKLLLF